MCYFLCTEYIYIYMYIYICVYVYVYIYIYVFAVKRLGEASMTGGSVDADECLKVAQKEAD